MNLHYIIYLRTENGHLLKFRVKANNLYSAFQTAVEKINNLQIYGRFIYIALEGAILDIIATGQATLIPLN